MKLWTFLATVATGFAACALAVSAQAAITTPVGSVVASVHNLNNVYGSGTVGDAYGANQVCMPCHTPHQMPAANVADNLAKLWNHEVNPASSYTLYGTSSSYLTSIDEVSRKCLGCHDGTLAVDSYGAQIGGATTGTMASGTDSNGQSTAGFVIGAGGNLQHDHPIDVLYNSASNYSLTGTGPYTATWSTSARNNDPASFSTTGYTSQKWGAQTYTVTGLSAIGFYKNGTNQTVTSGGNSATTASLYVYCRSCHDPHNNTYRFMRIPNDNSQVCLTCHNK